LRGRRVVSFCFRSVPPWAFESLEAIPTLPVDLHGTTARNLFDRCSSSDRGACDQRQGARNDSHARKCGERSQSHEVQHQSFSLGAEVGFSCLGELAHTYDWARRNSKQSIKLRFSGSAVLSVVAAECHSSGDGHHSAEEIGLQSPYRPDGATAQPARLFPDKR
jgi:hypothetical protein